MAQDGESLHADNPDSSEAFRLIQERRRDLSHPAEPLELSGAFESGRSLTAERSSLQRSTFTPVLVDEHEAHERQLAMLEDRATYFGSNLPSSRSGDARKVKAPVGHQRPLKEEDPSSSRASWLAALAVAALGTCALVLQGRR